MIRSLLDTDLYKLTMGQAILKHFPRARAKYVFTDRNQQTNFTPEFVARLKQELVELSTLRLSRQEATWLSEHCPFLEPWYIDWLTQFQFAPQEVDVDVDGGKLAVTIYGPWCETVYWEVPLMATICELYYELIDPDPEELGPNLATVASAYKKAVILAAANVKYADFGTRRRRGRQTHGAVVKVLATHAGGSFMGTSNVHFAQKFGVKAIGTMAHEWIMGVGAMRGLRYANRYAMELWNAVYHGNLGIALSDTYGTDAFLRDFDGTYARLFDGVRQDSGDPLEFIKKICLHYEQLRIPFDSKTIVFSDGLNVAKAAELQKCCESVGVKAAFGIGTNLTNDDPDSPPLNIVIKLHKLNDVPLAKLSDEPGKAAGHPDAIKEAKFVFRGESLV